MALLEQGIGDPWNQAGDLVLTDAPLQIPNLARMLGQAEYLNPALFPGESTFEFTEFLGYRFENENVGHFLFAPTEGTTTGGGIPSSYDIVVDTNGNFVTPVTNEHDVDAAGKFWVDQDTGRFRVYGVIDSADRIAYQVNPAASDGWVVGEETLPNVIPDPGQTEFTGCRISSQSGKYFLHLPPRMPLALADRERPSRYPSSGEYTSSLNRATTLVTPYKFWQSASVNALTGAGSEHYRYRLPKEILDEHGALSAGAEYPQGLFFLWDQNTQTIIEAVRFYKPSTGGFLDYTLEIESDEFDLSTVVTTTEAEADYNSTGLSLIACGSPLSRSVWTLASAFYRHGHRHDGTLEDAVSHQDLHDLNPPVDDHSAHNGRYPTDLPPWAPSNWAQDTHTSLLSRGGSHSSRPRDIYNNAMLGHFLLANQDPANYLDGSTPSLNGSYHIQFGDLDGFTIKQWGAFAGPGAGGLGISKNSSDTGGVWISPGGDTVYIGDWIVGGVDRDESLVVKNTDKTQVLLWDAGSDSRGASLLAHSSGTAWFSNADDFYGNGRSGNGWMNVGGMGGVYLRYGDAGTNNEGTIGLTLSNAGDVSVNVGDFTVDAGDLYVTTGDAEITAGDLTITAGDLDVVAGKLGWLNSADGFNFLVTDRVTLTWGASTVRDGATDPGNDGFRMGYCGSTTQALVQGDISPPNDFMLIEKTDGHSGDPDGAIIFANTGNDGVINASLMLDGVGNLTPGYDSAQTLGSNTIRWSEGYFDDVYVTDDLDVGDRIDAGGQVSCDGGSVVLNSSAVSLGTSNVMWFEKDTTNNSLAFHNVSVSRDRKSAIMADSFFNFCLWPGSLQTGSNNPAFRIAPYVGGTYQNALDAPCLNIQSLETNNGDNAQFMIARNAYRDQDTSNANDLCHNGASGYHPSSILFDTNGTIQWRWAYNTTGTIDWRPIMKMTWEGIGVCSKDESGPYDPSDVPNGDPPAILGWRSDNGAFSIVAVNDGPSGGGFRSFATDGTNGAISMVFNKRPTSGNGFLGSFSIVGGLLVFQNASDMRLKENVRDVEMNCLDTIRQLPVRKFNWIESGEEVAAGFIAQEVEDVYPEMVSQTDPDTDMLAVSVQHVVPVLVKAMQQQQEIIDDLTARLEALEG